jgi:hypothetical protein
MADCHLLEVPQMLQRRSRYSLGTIGLRVSSVIFSPVISSSIIPSLRSLQIFIEPIYGAADRVDLVFPLLESVTLVWIVVCVHDLAVLL